MLRVTRENLIYDLRLLFSTIAKHADSEFLAIQESMVNLFYSERPYYMLVTRDLDHSSAIRSTLLSKRGIRSIVYEEIITTEEVRLGKKNPNDVAFFLGSADQVFSPYILLISSLDPTIFLYARKMGMVILSYVSHVPTYDYMIDDDFDLQDICGRAISVQPPGNIHDDLFVEYDSSMLDSHMQSIQATLSRKLNCFVDLKLYQPAIERKREIKPDLPTPSLRLYTPTLDSSVYILTYYEVLQILNFNEFTSVFHEVRMDSKFRPRKFLVAPSGTGKTTYIKLKHTNSNSFIDADTIFKFPKGKWWTDPEVRERTDSVNRQIIVEWLSAEADGKIIFYADDLGLEADVYVIPPREVLRQHLGSKKSKNQPTEQDLDRILSGAKSVPGKTFSNIPSAVSFLKRNGRLSIPYRNRYTFEYVFIVPRTALPNWEVQTRISAQTWLVKTITYTLAKMLELDSVDTEMPRRLAMLYSGYYPTTLHKSINGFLKLRGRAVALNISGHMTNALMLTNFYPLDCGRLLSQIEWNFELFTSRRALTKYEHFQFTHGYMAERMSLDRGLYKLWHNPPEWVLAVDSSRLWHMYLGWAVNEGLFSTIREELIKLGLKYPGTNVENMMVVGLRKDGFRDSHILTTEVRAKLKDWSPY